MSSIAVQTVIGDEGTKATTELTYGFNSLLNNSGFQFGANSNGLFLINQGETDNLVNYERTFTLATTDLGIRNPKEFRFIYIGFSAFKGTRIDIYVHADDQKPIKHVHRAIKSGTQRARIPIDVRVLGRYWTVKVSSMKAFRVDEMEVQTNVRSSGIIGY